jgi:hypothetical protein
MLQAVNDLQQVRRPPLAAFLRAQRQPQRALADDSQCHQWNLFNFNL